MFTVTVKHTWEAGHRLPHIEGKCQSLHGHSWSVEAEVTAMAPEHEGLLIEFGEVKRILRNYIDGQLDHGLMLGMNDPLVPILRPHGKVLAMGEAEYTEGLEWPTVENVAALLVRVLEDILPVQVVALTVRETPVNAATWRWRADR